MAKRYHIDFNSLLSEPWTVEVHDTDFGGASAEINGRYQGFSLNYDPLSSGQGSADMFVPVMASSVTFDMLIGDAGLETFLSDLATSRENRFHLAIYRNSVLYWIGFIVADEVRVDDQDFPYNLSLFAIDGMSRLKEMDYLDPGTGLKYTGRENAIAHFYNIIEILGLTGVVTMPAAHFKTNFNWYSDSMTKGSGFNGLTQFDIDHIVFQQVDSEGNDVVWNCLEVLEALCRGLGGRFYMADGHWWFMQSAEYTTTLQTVWTFNAAGAQTGYNSGTSYGRDIDKTTRFKLNGGSFTFLRPMKKVVVDYHHLSGMNRAEGLHWNEVGPLTFVELPGVLGIDASNESQMHIRVPFVVDSTYQVLNPAHVYKPHQYVFKLTVKAGTEYLNLTAVNNVYEWTSIASEVEVRTMFVTESMNQVPTLYAFETVTDYIPTSMDGDNIEVKIILEKVVDQAGTTITEGVFVDYVAFFKFDVDDMKVVILNEGLGNNPAPDVERHEVADSVDGNTGVYKVETFFGDGPLPATLSRLTDGTDNTENWGVDTITGTDTISTLLATEILNLRQPAAKVYQGVYFAGDFHIYSRAVDGTEAFIPIRLKLAAFDDQWSGDFVQVETGIYTPTPSPPYIPGNGNGGLPGRLKQPSTGPAALPEGENLSPVVTNNLISNSPTTSSDGLVGATVDPSLPINAVNYSFTKQGDTVWLMDPNTGYTETFTVTTTPAPNATTLGLTGTSVLDFPAGSYLIANPSNKDRGFSKLSRNFTGTVWPIAVSIGILPQEADIGIDEMVRRYIVYRSGVRLFYSPIGSPYPDAFYTTTDRIIFHQKCRDETVHLQVIP